MTAAGSLADRADRFARELAADRRRAWREATVERLFRHGSLLVVEQALAGVPDVPAPEGVRFAPFAGDWALLAAVSGRDAARFRRAAARGRTCIAAWRGARLVGYTWVSAEVTPAIEGVPLRLPRGAVYGWNLYVPPTERAHGIGSALTAARLRWAREQGYRSMWRCVAPHNGASLATLARTAGPGTTIHGELRYVMLGPLWWTRLRPAPAR